MSFGMPAAPRWCSGCGKFDEAKASHTEINAHRQTVCPGWMGYFRAKAQYDLAAERGVRLPRPIRPHTPSGV